MSQLLTSDGCDVVILDLDSNYASLDRRMKYCLEIATHPVPSVVMADDSLRASAIELVQLGSHGYCRKPPSVRELKAMLLRARRTPRSPASPKLHRSRWKNLCKPTERPTARSRCSTKQSWRFNAIR